MCPEHTIPLKKSIADFAIVVKDSLFWLIIVMSRECGLLTWWRHIRRLFLHAQIGTKAIF